MTEYRRSGAAEPVQKNIAYYFICCVVITAAALTYYACAAYEPDGVMRLLLAPYARAAELFMNMNMRYADGIGYTAPELPFSIGSNCSGVNYMAALYCMMTFMFLHKIPKKYKLLWIAAWAPGAAAVGITITALRIIGSIPLAGYERFSTLHAGIGISFYLAGMILCFMVTEKLLNKKTAYS